MVQVIYSPKWFYGGDIIIDLVSIFVLLSIALFSLRSYKIRKNRNYIYLAVSFIVLAGSFLFRILTNFTVYYNILETRDLGFVNLTYQTIKASDALFIVGFFVYRLLNLLGLYMLYSIYNKQPKSNIFLIVYLIFVSTTFNKLTYHVFHLTSFTLLALITRQYFKNYSKNRKKVTKFIGYSFGVVASSEIFFELVTVTTRFYVVAEIVQLIGYTLLLGAFFMVLRYGREKDKD
ncbi:hypothetical protein HYW20_07730 [Candidatus Woesearchaeota archaeon]|nr:hypothetical protein [Candidatus Woesearchaeota archaeon]